MVNCKRIERDFILMQNWRQVNGYTFRGSNSFFFIFVSHLIRDELLKTQIYSLKSQSFPLRMAPIENGCIVHERKQEVPESCSSL